MKIKILIFLSLLSNIFSCQEIEVKENKQTYTNNKQEIINKSNILMVLEKQLKDGYREEPIDLNELKALFEIETILLQNNGYEKPIMEEFTKKIKLIFKKEINNSNGFICFDINKPCNDFNQNTWENSDLTYIFFLLKNRFITNMLWLPEILDYQKEYPELYKKETHIENTDVRLWKDIDFLPQQRRFNQQLLISRNKYLFNDDKSRFSWLITNDADFMESLVTTFGYTKDKKLLNWVMEKNKSNSEDFIVNNVFVKNCQGQLEIREGILKYIEENTNENDNTYYNALESFGYHIRYNKDINKNEKVKIIAFIANTLSPLFYKYTQLNGNAIWKPGTMLYNLSVSNENLISEIEKNNYYNLPNLKEVIENLEEEAPPLPAD